MKITERGQVTIPQELREQYGFLPGTEVEFVAEDGTLKLLRRRESRVAAVREMYGRKQFSRSTDELMKLLRG